MGNQVLKKALLAIALFLTAFQATAQNYKEMYLKEWNKDNPLDWNDFSIRHLPDSQSVFSDLNLKLTTIFTTIKKGNLRIKTRKEELTMNRILSWYDPDHCDNWTLRKEQVIFDIAEYHRRQFQQNLNKTWINNLTDSLMYNSIELFREEINNADDTVIITKYEKKYRMMLDSIGSCEYDVNAIDDSITGVKRYSAVEYYMGYNNETYFGTIADGLKPFHGISLGFDIYLMRFMLNLQISFMGSGKLKNNDFYFDSSNNYAWRKGYSVTERNLNLDLGYIIYDGPYLSITPFIGIGQSVVKQKTNLMKDPDSDHNYEIITSKIKGLKTQAGVNIDWKHYRSHQPFWVTVELKTRFRIFGAITDFEPYHDSYSLNAGLIFTYSLR